MSKKTKSRPKC